MTNHSVQSRRLVLRVASALTGVAMRYADSPFRFPPRRFDRARNMPARRQPSTDPVDTILRIMSTSTMLSASRASNPQNYNANGMVRKGGEALAPAWSCR